MVTSQSPQAEEEGLAASGIQLETFDAAEGVAYLTSVVGASTSSDAEQGSLAEAANIFDGLPLGLKVAGSFMRSKRISARRFLMLYSRSLEEVEQSSLPGTSKSLDNIWNMSLDSISSSAIALLDVIVFYDRDDLPMELFTSPQESPSANTRQKDFHDALGSLAQHSLITVADSLESISIQKYSQASMMKRVRGCSNRYAIALSAALRYLCETLPPIAKAYMGRRPENWPAFERYLPHLRILLSSVQSSLPPEAAGLGVDLFCRFRS